MQLSSILYLDGSHGVVRYLVLIQLQRVQVRKLCDGASYRQRPGPVDLVAAQVQLPQPGQALRRNLAFSSARRSGRVQAL